MSFIRECKGLKTRTNKMLLTKQFSCYRVVWVFAKGLMETTFSAPFRLGKCISRVFATFFAPV